MQEAFASTENFMFEEHKFVNKIRRIPFELFLTTHASKNETSHVQYFMLQFRVECAKCTTYTSCKIDN